MPALRTQFEMFLDDLPIWDFVGEQERHDPLLGHIPGARHFLYTHLHFSIAYNGQQVIAVNVSSSNYEHTDITDASELDVTWSYSVSWVETSIPYEKRMERYASSSFLPASFEIHWLSIINSFVLVVLLTTFLAVLLSRVVHTDVARLVDAYDEEDGFVEKEEDAGWKWLHGDVFRIPENHSLLCSFVGSGTHLLVTLLIVLTTSLTGVFHPTRRGALYSAILICYSLTASVGGYVSARMYRHFGGEDWVWNIVRTSVLFPGPFFAMFCYLNTVAIAHGSTAALPAGTIAVIVALFLLICLPMTVLGGIAGRAHAKPFQPPCKPRLAVREVPATPWYSRTIVQVLVAGFLPFSAIYIELHYIFAAVWGHKIYTLFGILLLAFIMLMLVTSFITIALSYFQLALEDHKWWWRSVLCGGSTGIFVYLYCFFYYFQRSEMFGFMQTSFFFGYMLCMSYGFFILLGTVGFFSSFTFVKYIYSAIKSE
eukprot:PLAT482.1.p2 GENE.PLAT482.1~~PLAT482.1.p2  ORF type:complete len:483 (-),score=252.62 PLAT482.1:48-1496(-)